jgi:hypothetical protein
MEAVMASSQCSTAVSVFDTRSQAEEVVEELRSAGFHDEQIGVAARWRGPGAEARTRAVGGAGLLAGAAADAVGGGLVAALMGLGIPEEEARYYDTEFRAGRTILTVRGGPLV